MRKEAWLGLKSTKQKTGSPSYVERFAQPAQQREQERSPRASRAAARPPRPVQGLATHTHGG